MLFKFTQRYVRRFDNLAKADNFICRSMLIELSLLERAGVDTLSSKYFSLFFNLTDDMIVGFRATQSLGLVSRLSSATTGCLTL